MPNCRAGKTKFNTLLTDTRLSVNFVLCACCGCAVYRPRPAALLPRRAKTLYLSKLHKIKKVDIKIEKGLDFLHGGVLYLQRLRK